MRQIKVHIVYEYGNDLRPHSSSYIRLLRPLTHPGLADRVKVTFGPRYQGERVDAVMVDRLWRPDITPEMASQLVENVHRCGARLVYAIDDNLMDLPLERSGWPEARHLGALQVFLDGADAVWVPSPPLKERLASLNPHVAVIPNTLDERLLAWGRGPSANSLFRKKRLVIGFMGTQTHDEDLLMVLPALQQVWHRHPDELEFQIIGGAKKTETLEDMEGIHPQIIRPALEENEYPLFILWFTNHVSWDIAIAPLIDTPFKRCKSDIKFLDYSAIGAATIASQVPAYEGTIRHAETGWLVANTVEAWSGALECLINKIVLRRQMGYNANRFLFTERILRTCSDLWLAALEGSL